jgi:hypothetical protein
MINLCCGCNGLDFPFTINIGKYAWYDIYRCSLEIYALKPNGDRDVMEKLSFDSSYDEVQTLSIPKKYARCCVVLVEASFNFPQDVYPYENDEVNYDEGFIFYVSPNNTWAAADYMSIYRPGPGHYPSGAIKIQKK